jgi:DNA topoisomerase-2
LQNAIIGMAQDFVGSNNINLLKPNGQLGTRRVGGKDASAPRYIFTQLSDITSAIYKKADSSVLTYLNDDGLQVEPEYYMPIIPMVLINGAIGIGTGFSTNVPCYNPMDIVAVLKRLLKDEDIADTELAPWYRGFKGVIEKNDHGKFVSRGMFVKTSPTKVDITELPVGMWTLDFKEMLEEYMDKSQDIKNYDSQYTEADIHFTLHFATPQICDEYVKLQENGTTKLENVFKLVSTKNMSTSNMYLFNSKCQIQKYDTAVDIIRDFYAVRLTYYQKRKDRLQDDLTYDIRLLENKIRFLKEVVAERITVHKMRKEDLMAKLKLDDYLMHQGSFDYILRIPIYNMTIDKLEDLEKEKKSAHTELQRIKDIDVRTWWSEELDEFSSQYDKFLQGFDKKKKSKSSTCITTSSKKKITKK